jgi:hypothetical protein
MNKKPRPWGTGARFVFSDRNITALAGADTGKESRCISKITRTSFTGNPVALPIGVTGLSFVLVADACGADRASKFIARDGAGSELITRKWSLRAFSSPA